MEALSKLCAERLNSLILQTVCEIAEATSLQIVRLLKAGGIVGEGRGRQFAIW